MSESAISRRMRRRTANIGLYRLRTPVTIVRQAATSQKRIRVTINCYLGDHSSGGNESLMQVDLPSRIHCRSDRASARWTINDLCTGFPGSRSDASLSRK
jgi:hypothetical protein